MPETFCQYSLISELAKKYSHSTYLASPTNPQRGHDGPESQAVLTVFASSLFHSPREREKLLKKAKYIQKLQHPYLVPILDMGIEGEQAFVVRQYLPNGSLRSRLKQLSPDRMPLQDALTLISEVGEAIAYAHEHNIVHGNIKPENILFNADDQVVLTDFHLVSRTDAIIRDQTAEEYAFCYLAPEQLAGNVSFRSDQYALACLTYELITGQVPFAAQHLPSMISQPNYALPAPFSERVGDLSPSLEAAVMQALAYDPDERFFDFSLFLEVIKSALLRPPSFPFGHPNLSRENSRLLRPIPQSREPFGISPQADVGVTESSVTPLVFQTSRYEWAGTIPLSESLERLLSDQLIPSSDEQDASPLEDPENLDASSPFEQDASPLEDPENLDASSPFEQEESGALSAIASPISSYGHSDSTVDEEILSIRKSPKTAVSRTGILLYSRRRALELGILLSVIVAVVCSALWLSGGMPSGIPGMPRTSLDPTKEARQPITKISTVQPSVQPIAVGATLLSAQATTSLTPTGQPVGGSGSSWTAQPPPSGPLPTPTPVPTPTPPVSYEAEASQNTLSNGATVIGCSVCSDGKRVGYIGLNGGNAGTLQFNGVNKNVSGQYTLTIYYIIAGSDQLTLDISVNGGPEVALNVASTANGDTLGTASITVNLNAGNNTIEFSNPSVPAPDIDRIVV